MKNLTALLLVTGFLAASLPVSADLLELKNGTSLNGTYAGGTAGTVRFDTPAGQQVIERSQIVAITFSSPTPAAAGAAAVQPAQPVAAAQGASSATLPAGTTLLVRMVDNISSASAPGANFTTKLEYDLAVNNVVVVKAGTPIYGKVQSSTQARRAAGKSTLDIRLTQIAAGGNPLPIMTSSYKEAGEASIKKAARGAAAGAAIGAAAGDAGKGAAVGASAGALKKGETVTIPPGTLLEFDLTQPITIR
jgi:hypothetical protein